MRPIDSPEQRKAQRDEAERINQLIRRRKPADEQPVDESNVDAGDATDAVATRSIKGPSGGSRVKSGEIGFGEDEARLLPETARQTPFSLSTRIRTLAPAGPNPRPSPELLLAPNPGALARDRSVAARAWRY